MSARSAACVLMLAMWALPALAQVQVQRWVDEQGRVHYGDRPLGSNGRTLRIRAESATAPGGAATNPTAPRAPGGQRPGRAASMAPCKAGGGADCDALPGARSPSSAGASTAREESRLASLLARREACARTPGAPGC